MSEPVERVTLIGYGCGACADVRQAAQVPDVCVTCSARFDLGAPLALLWVRVVVGWDAGISIRFELVEPPELRGDWPDWLRQQVVPRLRLVGDMPAK